MSIEDIERRTCSNPKCNKELSFKQDEIHYTLKRSVWTDYCECCRRTVDITNEFSFCSIQCLFDFVIEEKKKND